MPIRSNFPKFMFVDFSKVYVAITYQAKPFYNPSTGSPFFLTVFLVILRPPLITVKVNLGLLHLALKESQE